MRKLTYSMMVSLDGFIETPKRSIGWIIIDEELHTFANDQAREQGAFLYGRRLYQVMADYWPTADAQPSAPAFEVDFARIGKPNPRSSSRRPSTGSPGTAAWSETTSSRRSPC